jgi:hypothetical protein
VQPLPEPDDERIVARPRRIAREDLRREVILLRLEMAAERGVDVGLGDELLRRRGGEEPAHADLHVVRVFAVVVDHLGELRLVRPLDGARVDVRAAQRCRNFRKHSRKRPVARVPLPNTSQRISVSASVSAPSATSHTLSAIADASSNSSTSRFPSLCSPANASVLCSDHGTRSKRHVFSCSGRPSRATSWCR